MSKPMSGSDIARELGISRQAVSATLRRSLKKMYKVVLSQNIADSPFQAVLSLMGMLNVNSNSIHDMREFIAMFDNETIEKVMEDAKTQYNIK